MDLRRFGVLIMLCLVAVGCRKDPYMDAYFELLNSEKRVLEDRLYELEYTHQKALKELEQYRAGKKKATDAQLQPEPDSQPDQPRDSDVDSGGDSDDEMQLDIPDIELPPGFESGQRHTPENPIFRTASASDHHSGTHQRPGSQELSDKELAAAIVAALDQEVDHVVINARLTGGVELDDQPGDDGLNVLIEPRNKQGHFVAVPSAMTIVLLDPALAAQSARVAKWEIDEQAARLALKSGTQKQGMSFRLPWPGDKPEHEHLNLYVRYHNPSGVALEADRQIRVSPNGRVAQRWTPRSSRPPEQQHGPEATVAWQTTEESTEPTTVQAIAEEEVPPTVPSPQSSKIDNGASPAVGRFWKPQR